MCFQDEDLMTLSSTYADMLATFGCRICNAAFAHAVTGRFTNIIENEHPCAKELVIFLGFPNCPLSLKVLTRFK